MVQLYVQDEGASVSRPVKELKGFKRVSLFPGEEKTVISELSADQLAFYDRHMRLIVEPGWFKVIVGSSSEDVRLTGGFEITGNTRVLHSRGTFCSKVTIS